MNKFNLLTLLTLIVLGCTNNLKRNVYNQIKNDFGISHQIFIINPHNDTILKCKNGTTIYLMKNTLCYNDDTQLLSKDTISIYIIEYTKIGQMFINNLGTLSDNKIIETGGMLNIIAKQNNKRLKLKEGSNIRVYFPCKKKDYLPFYSKFEQNNYFDWNIISRVTTAPPRRDTSLFSGDTLKWNKNDIKMNILSFSRLGWINCDRFLNFDDLTEIYVKAEENMDSSTFCSVILKNYNSIIPGKLIQNNAMRFSPLPNNEPVILFLISYKGDKYYMGFKDIVVKSKEVYSVSLEEVSKEQLKAKIEEFDKGRPL